MHRNAGLALTNSPPRVFAPQQVPSWEQAGWYLRLPRHGGTCVAERHNCTGGSATTELLHMRHDINERHPITTVRADHVSAPVNWLRKNKAITRIRKALDTEIQILHIDMCKKTKTKWTSRQCMETPTNDAL